MDLFECSKIVFRSSAAVYDSSSNPILKEDNNLSPTSTYGETKLEGEQILKYYFFKKQKNGFS